MFAPPATRASISRETLAAPAPGSSHSAASFAFASFSRPEFLIDRAPDAFDLIRRSPYAAALQPLGHETVPNLGIARPEPATYSFYRIDWAAFDSLRARRSRMEDPSGAAR